MINLKIIAIKKQTHWDYKLYLRKHFFNIPTPFFKEIDDCRIGRPADLNTVKQYIREDTKDKDYISIVIELKEHNGTNNTKRLSYCKRVKT